MLAPAFYKHEINQSSLFYFRNRGERHQTDQFGVITKEKNSDDAWSNKQDDLLCKACKNKISANSEKIPINGRHQHTFANPNGIIFDIGCFKTAPGCRNTGVFTAEFSWFSGFKWQISVCSSCFTHLGWLFVSLENQFYGLILERLAESR